MTSILGIILIAAAVASPFLKESIDWADATIGVCAGVLMLLSPDTLVAKLQGVLGKS